MAPPGDSHCGVARPQRPERPTHRVQGLTVLESTACRPPSRKDQIQVTRVPLGHLPQWALDWTILSSYPLQGNLQVVQLGLRSPPPWVGVGGGAGQTLSGGQVWA